MNRSIKVAHILMLICASVVSLSACSAPTKALASKASAPLSQSYDWYDGNRKQTVWLNPQVVAEFNANQQSAVAAKAIDAHAQMLAAGTAQRGVNLWKMQSTVTSATVRSLSLNNPGGKYSPVFHDNASGSGAMRALPGNIIIYLNPAWDATKVGQWLQTRKLEVVKKMDIGSNIYILKTAPGLDALNLANQLYLSGEVTAAFPEWWQEVTPR